MSIMWQRAFSAYVTSLLMLNELTGMTFFECVHHIDLTIEFPFAIGI